MRSWNDAVIEAVTAGAQPEQIRRSIDKAAGRRCVVSVDSVDAIVPLLVAGWSRSGETSAEVDVDPLSPPYDPRLCGLGA